MKHQEIMELIDHFAGSGLQSMKLAQEGVSLELHRGAAAAKPEVRSAEIMPVPEEAHHHSAAGRNFLRGPRTGPATLCDGGSACEKGTDRVSAGGHEDDERDSGSLRLRH